MAAVADTQQLRGSCLGICPLPCAGLEAGWGTLLDWCRRRWLLAAARTLVYRVFVDLHRAALFFLSLLRPLLASCSWDFSDFFKAAAAAAAAVVVVGAAVVAPCSYDPLIYPLFFVTCVALMTRTAGAVLQR